MSYHYVTTPLCSWNKVIQACKEMLRVLPKKLVIPCKHMDNVAQPPPTHSPILLQIRIALIKIMKCRVCLREGCALCTLGLFLSLHASRVPKVLHRCGKIQFTGELLMLLVDLISGVLSSAAFVGGMQCVSYLFFYVFCWDFIAARVRNGAITSG